MSKVICPKCMAELPSKEAYKNHVCATAAADSVDKYNATNKSLKATVEKQKKIIEKLTRENEKLKSEVNSAKVEK